MITRFDTIYDGDRQIDIQTYRQTDTARRQADRNGRSVVIIHQRLNVMHSTARDTQAVSL